MSYFSTVIGRNGAGWRALDVDLEDVESLDELAEMLRAASRKGEPVIAVLEREDEWFALVRVDGDDDPRAFVSDLAATERSRYGDVLAPVGDLELADYPELRTPVRNGTVADDLGGDEDDDPADVDDATDTSAGAEDGDNIAAGADDDLARAAVDPDLPPAWVGDPALLADFGVPPVALVDLVLERAGDPASALADLGERCGFDELLEALR